MLRLASQFLGSHAALSQLSFPIGMYWYIMSQLQSLLLPAHALLSRVIGRVKVHYVLQLFLSVRGLAGFGICNVKPALQSLRFYRALYSLGH